MEPTPEPRLPDALTARLRALPAPDPGAAYFDALPNRVAARVRRAEGRPVTADRTAVRPARTRRAVWALAAAAVLVVLVWGLPQARRQSERTRIAQQLPPAPPANKPTGPVQTPATDTAPKPVLTAPAHKESAPRRSSTPPRTPQAAPRRREATTARPRGALTLAAAESPETLPVSAALVHTLERARVVLLTLAHADSTDDLGVLQPLAEALVADLAAQRPAFDAADPALRTVADRLEPLLLTLAHPGGAPGAMTAIRARLKEDETLFRLNVALLAAAPAVPVD